MCLYKQLCWSCKNAYSNCSWSKNFIPVDNWVATPTKIKCRYKNGIVKEMDSYRIIKCPLYEREVIQNKSIFLEICEKYKISYKTAIRYKNKSKNIKQFLKLCEDLYNKKNNKNRDTKC